MNLLFVFDMVCISIIAALTGMGIGGGSLLVIYLTLVRHVPQLDAQGLNLAFFLFASLASLPIHFRRRAINYRMAVVLIVCGIAGSLIGSSLAAVINPSMIRRIFGVLLILSGGSVIVRALRERRRGAKE